jgi:hypothetical protein
MIILQTQVEVVKCKCGWLIWFGFPRVGGFGLGFHAAQQQAATTFSGSTRLNVSFYLQRKMEKKNKTFSMNIIDSFLE